MRKLLLLFAGLILLAKSYSQIGKLDHSFGDKGITKVDFPEFNAAFSNIAHKVLQKGDGTYYVLIEINGQAVIAHRLADGTADVSYYNNGYSAPAYFIPQDAALQSDGKIVVAGYTITSTGNAFALTRYNMDGSVDNSFGTKGLVTTAVSDAVAYAVIIQNDGKIVAAGYVYDRNNNGHSFTLTRYNPNGSLDASFGTNGIVVTPFNYVNSSGNTNSEAIAYSISIENDGKIVAAGMAYTGDGYVFALARYATNGNLDNTFGTNGRVQAPFGSNAYAYAVTIQADGKIVAAGDVDGVNESESEHNFALARYNTNGSLDNTFGTNGIVTTQFTQTDLEGGGIYTTSSVAYSVHIQQDGKIVAGGATDLSNNNGFALARYNADGSLDTSFDTDGTVTTPFYPSSDFNTSAAAYSLIIQSDEKIVAVGMDIEDLDYHFNRSGGSAFALARYNSDGTLDDSFGLIRGHISTGVSNFNDAIVQPDGKIVAVGSTQIDFSEEDPIIARFNPDGSLDNTFGSNGRIQTNYYIFYQDESFDAIFTSFKAVVIQNDGKIIAAGVSNPSGAAAGFTLARYNADGSLDNTFGTRGIVVTSIDYDAIAYSVTIQRDGKIVIAGTADSENGPAFALARFNPDGSLDNTFGSNGIVQLPINGSAYSLIVQSDGKMLVTGGAISFVLARLNTNGSLDASFGNNGITTAPFTYNGNTANAAAKTLKIQEDGKIIAAGQVDIDASGTYTSTYAFALARYNSNGTLDNSFGTNGRVITSFNESTTAYSINARKDGKLLVAGGGGGLIGFSGDELPIREGGGHFALARYNANGSLDESFGTGGKVATPINFGTYATLFTPNRIYAVGATSYYGIVSAVGAFQYNTSNSNSLVSSFTLINADIDKGIKELKEGSVIDLASLTTIRLNMRANNTPATVDSISFTLTGRQQHWHTEIGIPYSLFNDNSGDYKGWTPAPGAYTLTATPYLKGSAGTPLTIHFTVTPFLVNSFTLVNADTDTDLTPLRDHAVIDLSTLPTQHLNIRATVRPYHVGSVLLTLDGKTRVENGYPYAAGGDTNGDYFAMTLTPGPHTLTATPYSKHTPFEATTGEGIKGEALTIHFTVIGSAVTRLVLVNAETDQDLQGITNGDVINLSTLPTRQLNIRAITNPERVGSVVFNLDGKIQVTEDYFPYTIGGDINGHFRPWSLPTGHHQLTVTPYWGSNGTGSKGAAYSVTFSVIDPMANSLMVTNNKVTEGRDVSAIKGGISAWPNPFTSSTTLSFSIPNTAYTTITLYDEKGRRVTQLYAAVAEAGKVYQIALANKGWSSGVYVVQLTTGDYSQSYKLLLSR